MPGMGELMVLMMILAVMAVGLGVWIWALVDCVTKEPPGTSEKTTWILVISLTGWLGAIIYFAVRRPQRRAMYGV